MSDRSSVAFTISGGFAVTEQMLLADELVEF
jgi:hypothetical protein